MYNLRDLQLIFNTNPTRDKVLIHFSSLIIIDRVTHVVLKDNSIIVYLGNRIIHIRVNVEPVVIIVDDVKKYVDRIYF